MKPHHIVIIVGVFIVLAIWYMSKQATSLGNNIMSSPVAAPDTSTSTRSLYESE